MSDDVATKPRADQAATHALDREHKLVTLGRELVDLPLQVAHYGPVRGGQAFLGVGALLLPHIQLKLQPLDLLGAPAAAPASAWRASGALGSLASAPCRSELRELCVECAQAILLQEPVAWLRFDAWW
eukprot:2669114-Prymnesium_polylepis.1